MDEGTTIVTVQMAPSISLEESKRIAMLVERRLMELPEIEEVVTVMGTGEVGGEYMPINMGDIYINYKPNDQWGKIASKEEVEDDIRNKLASVPGVIISLTQPIKMLTDELIEGVAQALASSVLLAARSCSMSCESCSATSPIVACFSSSSCSMRSTTSRLSGS